MSTTQSKKRSQLSFKVICSKLSYCRAEILEPLLELAVEIAREGREGRRIGTMFTIGDAEAVMAWSRPLILNPLEGHPRNLRQITSNELWGTVKELAQLDGAFVVSDDVVRVFEHGALVAEIIPELWLLSRHETALRGRIRRDEQHQLAIVTGDEAGSEGSRRPK